MEKTRTKDRPALSGEPSVVHQAATSSLPSVSFEARRPFRSLLAGYILYVIGWAIVAIVVIALFYARAQGDLEGNFSMLMKIALFVIAPLTFPFFYFGSKLTALTAEQILEKDHRPPVLYLRSFSSDTDEVPSRVFRMAASLARWEGVDVPYSEEEKLVAALMKIGPPIAIGRPGEKLPTLGAARLYVSDDAWQEVVTDLSERAALTVLRIGDTEGLWWEVRRVVRMLDPRRVVFYLPETTQEAKQPVYDAFRAQANEILPRPLPPEQGDATFIWFDATWRPILLRKDAVLLFDDRPPVLYLSTGTAGSDERAAQDDGNALAAVFAEVGPVIAIGRPGEKLPAQAAATLYVDDEDWPAVVADLSWQSTPLLLRLDDGERVAWVLDQVVATLDPQRVILYLPGTSHSERQRHYEAARYRLNEVLPHPLPEQPEHGRYLHFKAGWRPLFLDPEGLSWWRRLRLRGSAHAAARRIHAPALQPFFDKYHRQAPGQRLGRWVKVSLWAFALLFVSSLSISSCGEGSGPPPLDTSLDLTASWQGIAWGTPVAVLAEYFPNLDVERVDTSSTEVQSIYTGEARSLGGVRTTMRLLAWKGRLAGVVLVGMEDADLPDVRAALTAWLGSPGETGEERVTWWREPIEVMIRTGVPDYPQPFIVFANSDVLPGVRREAAREQARMLSRRLRRLRLLAAGDAAALRETAEARLRRIDEQIAPLETGAGESEAEELAELQRLRETLQVRLDALGGVSGERFETAKSEIITLFDALEERLGELQVQTVDAISQRDR